MFIAIICLVNLSDNKNVNSPTCLLFCFVLSRTICRMLELVMSETMSDTRFQTLSRAPHNMWYCRRRIPRKHSCPSSICLHLPFLGETQKYNTITLCSQGKFHEQNAVILTWIGAMMHFVRWWRNLPMHLHCLSSGPACFCLWNYAERR